MGRITIEDCIRGISNKFKLVFSATIFHIFDINDKEVQDIDVKLIGDTEDTDITLIGNSSVRNEEVHDANYNFIDVTINDNFDNILLERE